MCGIIGYVGPRECKPLLLQGLERLEYRGYDSAGIALREEGGLEYVRAVGNLQNLKEAAGPNGSTATHGLGHTRWATHGGVTEANAHPHLSGDRVAVIHNGIIENFSELKQELLDAGDSFTSETDTEVAALLVGRAYREHGDLTEALRATVGRLHGAFTLLVMHQDVPGVVVGARRNSPLVIGLGDGENFLGSDVAAFVEHTRHAMEIGQDEIVTIRPDSVEVIDFDGNAAATKTFEVAWDATAAEKGGWPSFMKKEISEEPDAVANTLLGRVHDGRVTLTELDAVADMLTDIDRVVVLACGTAAYAGMLGKYAIEQWSRIPVEVELSHEFRYRNPILNERTLVVSISQSGETMDTLMAVRFAKESGAKVLSICNTQGASIPRESDAVIYTHAGPEIGVASTKGFLTQLVACYLLALYLAQVKGTRYDE
jgi:glutamine---fructose-6-phosphate transaminase (isomerizing)